jgi:hypothetical protein
MATTRSMGDYNTIQKFLTEKNLHFFTFYTEAGKLVKAVIRHLPSNTSAEEITRAFQEIDKTDDCQMSHCRRGGGEGGAIHASLLVTLARSQKVQKSSN